MHTALSDTQGGFEHFVRSHREPPGHYTFTLVQFDSQTPFDLVHDGVPVETVGTLELLPPAATALLDAIGITIHHTERRLDDGPLCSK